MTVVVSAGDNGLSGTVNVPAADPNVIAAAAVDNFRLVAMDDGYKSYVSNNMAALSSGGTAATNRIVDLSAPGWYGTEAACADGSGSYTGPLSFKVSGQDWITTRASSPVVIPAHQGAPVPLRVAFPASPGDHPESVQFTASAPGGASVPEVASVPVARRTLISSSGGSFQTLITSTVGRNQGGQRVGQDNTYNTAYGTVTETG